MNNYEIYEIIVKGREKGIWTYKLYNIDDESITIKNIEYPSYQEI